MSSVRKILLCVLLALPFCATAQEKHGGIIDMKGSFLRQLQKRDSVLVADQLQYGFKLDNVEEGTGFSLPDLSKVFTDSLGIDLIAPWVIDTLKVTKAKKSASRHFDIEGFVVIAPFEGANYTLPRIAILRAVKSGAVDTLLFDEQKLEVRTMPVDTTTYKPHDIKGQIRYPLTFKELLPYIAAFYALAILTILVVCLVKMRRKKESGDVYREPAHVVALRKLDHFRGDKYWAPEKQKAFYSGITDALREYIVARYGVEAMEMTTAEIFSGLKGSDVPKELFDETESLFKRADYVKFAKYVADNQENAEVLPTAVRFVTYTYQKQLDEEKAKADAAKAKADAQTLNKESSPKREEDDSAYMPK